MRWILNLDLNEMNLIGKRIPQLWISYVQPLGILVPGCSSSAGAELRENRCLLPRPSSLSVSPVPAPEGHSLSSPSTGLDYLRTCQSCSWSFLLLLIITEDLNIHLENPTLPECARFQDILSEFGFIQHAGSMSSSRVRTAASPT